MIYVTHDQIEAMTVGQRVAIMYAEIWKCWTRQVMYTICRQVSSVPASLALRP